MHTLYYDWIGLLHLIASIVALASGNQVMWMKKGTKLHRQVGYLYVVSMLIIFITSFGIYRLFGGFGIFHMAAIIGFITLLAGMIPVMTKKPKGNWLGLHYSFMYWSVIGLYAAFISETLTRIPETPFLGMLGIASVSVMLVASICFRHFKKVWGKKYSAEKKLKHH